MNNPGEATGVQVGGDLLRPAGTVGAHQNLVADVATTLGSGQCPVGGSDEGDVVVGVVGPGVSRGA